ncbi:flagellar hook-basal body complex protein FliE [Methylopila sp. 73B]|uniref:flagellar hook-basal body complex protein FliE n=1 Tax=Methylopila sp. 73B TaxID=1120792 RepID=UPI00036C3B45|nr:flagellar hook-basal body complex protein FliE [Methylopila sp. 73B]
MTSPLAAANAYSSLSGIIAGGAPVRPGAGADANAFGDLLEKSLSGFAEQGRQTDAKAMQAVQGRGDVVDVVTAVAESELALQTLVSVRDKVIAAYDEVMRMPI